VKVLLISANTERINMVTMPLGLGLVAAARRAGHQVALLDLMAADDPRLAVRDAIVSARPEVIGISVRNIDDQNRQEPHFLLEKVKEVVTECRARSATTSSCPASTSPPVWNLGSMRGSQHLRERHHEVWRDATDAALQDVPADDAAVPFEQKELTAERYLWRQTMKTGFAAAFTDATYD
jgi:hypothetical protein